MQIAFIALMHSKSTFTSKPPLKKQYTIVHPVFGALASISLRYTYVFPYLALCGGSCYTLYTAQLVKLLLLVNGCCSLLHCIGCPINLCEVLRCTEYQMTLASEGLTSLHPSISSRSTRWLFIGKLSKNKIWGVLLSPILAKCPNHSN